ADAGFDVWLGNSRGNTWSSKHKTLKPCQKEFWQFRYSVEKELVKGAAFKGLARLGKSRPTPSSFFCSLLAAILMVQFVHLPGINISSKSYFLYSAVMSAASCPFSLRSLLLGCKGTLHQNELLKGPLTQFCRSLGKVCGSAFCYLAGGRIQNQNTSRMDVYIAHHPAGTSVQNFIHWHQMACADQFQAYDYGPKENMKKYNQSTPPAYKIEKTSTPVALWSGGQDKLADTKDMAKLLPRITNLIYHEHFPAWGHLDVVWGLDATEKMYRKIIELIRKHP
ncbi:LICH hydrolase, partial [Columbina picui]|nr:LICH hydrolase [Columbina picui]